MEIKNKFNIGDTVYVLYYGIVYEREITAIVATKNDFFYKLDTAVGKGGLIPITEEIEELHLFRTEKAATEKLENSLKGNLQCYVDYINREQPNFTVNKDIDTMREISKCCFRLNKKFKIVIVDENEESK